MTSETECIIATPRDWQEAYKAGDPQVTALYATRCFSWPAQGDTLALTAEEIAEWKQTIAALAGIDAASELLAPVDKLARRATRAVVTGQQVCAGLGPLFVLYKAFAAKHWAERIASDESVETVPLFWLASEDHDVAEVERVTWLSRDGERESAPLSPAAATAGFSVSDVPIDRERAEAFLKRFEETTIPSEFQPGLLDDLRSAFLSDGATFESSFLLLYTRTLLSLGIVPMMPRLKFVRRRALPIIRKEIETAGRSTEMIQEVSREMSELGMKPPLHRNAGDVNFFFYVDGVRGKVVQEDGKFRVLRPDESKALLAEYTAEEWLGQLNDLYDRFSPNAALRPLVQDTIFPSAAYIAGPTELVYHAQLGKLYEHFGVHRPAVFPRPNVVLLDTKTEKALEKLELNTEDATAASPEELEELLKQAQSGNGAKEEYSRRADAVRKTLKELQTWLEDFTPDTGVRKAAEKLTDGTETGLEKLTERFDKHLLTRDEDRNRAHEKLIQNLFPGGEPQERSITPLSPLLVQYGPEVIERLYNTIEYDRAGSQAVSMKGLVG